jgi:hypothetical protein
MKLSSVGRFVPLAALLVSASVQAQVLNSVGVKGGINFSASAIKFGADDMPTSEMETQRRTGWQAALFAEWLKMSVVSIVTQVEYAQRGYAEELPVTGENSPEPVDVLNLKTRLDYVSVPILLKLQTSNAGIKPYALAGPRFDFLVNRKPDYYEGGQLDLEVALADFFNDRAVGGTVGLGMTGKAFSLPLLVEARYNFDFNDNADSNQFLEVKNNAFDVWLGFTF